MLYSTWELKLAHSSDIFFFCVWQEIELLETSSLLNGIYLPDRHRDMRMDIDDMTYEVC